jgi:RHS repeat-associated protein
MPSASKHFDVILGLDVHIVQPPGTVPPAPIPHPFTAIVFDAFDYLPLIGSTVTVNGLPRGQAGTAGLALPCHLPIGGVFVKPPGNEGELLMGSSTVLAEGEPFSYLGLPVLSCSDIGTPPPPRPPKDPGDGKPPKPDKPSGGPVSLMAPMSVVLPIPMGRAVEIGGTPTISMTALAFHVGAAAFKGLRKLQKQSTSMQRVSARMHRRAEALMDAAGASDRARHRVHTALCAVTGHPVDLATGKVFTEVCDFQLHGPLPLKFSRQWLSTSGYQGPLGHGWHHAWDLGLRIDVPNRTIAVRLADGRVRAFPLLELGEKCFDRQEKIELGRDPLGFVLRERSGLAYRFSIPTEDQLWPVRAIEDRAGNRVELLRDARGTLVGILDSGRRRFAVLSDAQGRIVEIRGPHPTADGDIPLARYSYDRAGDLVEVRDALGHSHRYAYRQHLLVRETDRAGLSFHFEYDNRAGPTQEPHDLSKTPVRARCLRTWGDGGLYDRRLKFGDGQVEVTDSLGALSIYRFNDEGLVVRATDPLGHTTSVEFDEWNNETAEVDELGRTTRRKFDERGNLVEQIWPDGSTARMSWDGSDQLVRAIDQNGSWWQWRRDERGRLLERMDPDAGRTQLIWNGAQTQSLIDGRGGVTSLAHDAAGNLVRVQLPDGSASSWQYDRLGRRVASQGPRGNTQRLALDLGGHVAEVFEADGQRRRFVRDGEGRPVRIEDPLREMELRWIGKGKLVYRKDAGVETRFSYDAELRLQSVTNAHGDQYLFERDVRGEVVAEIGWAGDRREMERDAAGQIAKITQPSGAFAAYKWNRAGRLEKAEFDDGTAEHFVYRPDGLLTHARNATCTVKLERSAVGRITREWQDSHWIASRRDRAGSRVEVLSSYGSRLAIEVDAIGSWSRLSLSEDSQPRWSAATQRDLGGDEIDRALPKGGRDRWKRDALGRPAQHQVWDGRAVVGDTRYSWNVEGRLDSTLDAVAGQSTDHQHDPLGRLLSSRRGDQAEFRMPDALGNLYRSDHAVDRFYGPDGRLLRDEEPEGPAKYEYDADGRRVRRLEPDGGEWQYRWDRSGRLAALERPDGEIVEFGYDALGRRVWKRFKGETTRWVWDGDAIFHEWKESVSGPEQVRHAAVVDEDSTGFIEPAFVVRKEPRDPRRAPARDLATEEEPTGYVEPAFVVRREPAAEQHPPPPGLITWVSEPGTLAPAAKLVGGRAFSIVCDHLGTPVRLLDEANRTAWAGELNSWGVLTLTTGDAADCPFRFPGQYEDTETGLYYNRHRYYDPRAGQYLSTDPIRLNGGLNLFAYVGDPLTQVDLLGLIVDYESTMRQIQEELDFSSAPDGAVFWSGSRMEAAQDWANTHGKTTLEQTSGGKYLDGLDIFDETGSGLNAEQAAELWDSASQRFAEGASGEVNVFSTGTKKATVQGERTWWRVEKPALTTNARVTTIIRRRIDGDVCK